MENISSIMIDHYSDSKRQSFTATLENLRTEFQSLGEVLSGIFQSYTDHHSLGSRTRRSIIPVVGKIMSFMFGTVSESDLENVRRAIRELSRNQLDIMHILEEQISILNVSRAQIAENSIAILDLVKCVNLFDLRLSELKNAIEKRFEKVETFVNLYVQMDLIISGIKYAILRANVYLENLRLELNMLSLNHLSPSVITPINLRTLLLNVKTRLPFSLKLPEDPASNIWYFYRTLVCKTVLDEDKILVVINIPLLDQNGEYEVFKTHVLPLLWVNATLGTQNLPDMVASYDVQYAGLLINKERNKYILLDSDDLQACSNAAMKYCTPRNAILPVNLHQHCMLALFLKNNAEVDKFCHKIVTPNSVLPQAKYLSVGQWVVSSREPLKFSIVCTENEGQKSLMTRQTETVNPPLDVIRLDPGCLGSSNFLNLPPYYQFEEHISLKDPLSNLIKFKNKSEFRIWNPLEEAIPNFTKIKLPTNLGAIKQLPMDDLILRLRGLHKVEIEDTSWPWWVYTLISTGICLMGGGLVFMYFRYRKKKKNKNFETLSCCTRLAILFGDRDKADKTEPCDPKTAVSYSKETDGVTILQGSDKSVPPQEGITSDSFLQRIYPSLPVAPK